MAALIVLPVIGLWFWLAFKLATWCTEKLRVGVWRKLATLGMTIFFIALPLADEIVGGFQFRGLCESESFFKIDAEKIKGKKVKSVHEEKVIQRFPIKITYTHYSYRDSETGEELASYSMHHAEGGWLSRGIAFNTTNPWTFHSVCDLIPDRNFDFTIVR